MGGQRSMLHTLLACNLPNLECEQYSRINTPVSLATKWEGGVEERKTAINSKDVRIVSTSMWTFFKSWFEKNKHKDIS